MSTLERYRVWFNSEMNLGKDPSCGCYLGCGVSSAYHGAVDASLGEAATDRTGRLHSKRERTTKLKKGWRAFTRVGDSNGIPDTGDYLRISAAMWPGLPEPIKFWTRDFSKVIDHMDAGMGVSIALRLSVLPQDAAAARYTRADHQAYLQRRIGADDVNDVDPMHPHSNSYDGHRVPIKEIRKAAKAIEDGLILTWLYPRGEWTQERLTAKKIRRNTSRIIDAQQERIEALKATVAELEANPADCDPVIKAAVDEAFTDSIAASSAAIGSLREV